MSTSTHDLPEPGDGPTPYENTIEWQLRRLNRISAALWDVKHRFGDTKQLAMIVYPNAADHQIYIHIHSPADRAAADRLIADLGFDPEPVSRPHGDTVQHNWAGMLSGYRTRVCWVEPASGMPFRTEGPGQ